MQSNWFCLITSHIGKYPGTIWLYLIFLESESAVQKEINIVEFIFQIRAMQWALHCDMSNMTFNTVMFTSSSQVLEGNGPLWFLLHNLHLESDHMQSQTQTVFKPLGEKQGLCWNILKAYWIHTCTTCMYTDRAHVMLKGEQLNNRYYF